MERPGLRPPAVYGLLTARTFPEKPMRIKSSKIERLHENLRVHFGKRVKGAFSTMKFENDKGRDWESVSKDTRVKFWLAGSRDFARHKLSSKPFPVYKLADVPSSNSAVWFGWHEEWEKESNKVFDLIGVSMSFYWGFRTDPVKNQILRAEWDQVRHRGGRAGQPHWQIDAEIMAGFTPLVSNLDNDQADASPEVESTQAELDELPAEPAARELEEIGGWRNPGSYPARWQCSLDDNGESLLTEWADSTLEYAISEFRKLRHAGFFL
jgi:hypothetical protein